MRQAFVVSLAFLLLVIPARLFAKADISKITIEGAGLKTPIEITDAKTLANFNIWTGPGTSWTGRGSGSKRPEEFIIDWSRSVPERPEGLQRYKVSFYAKLPSERLVYVVFYEYDPVAQQGYVYLPGRTDESYRLNVSTIVRGVEGKWFYSLRGWDSVARPLIAGAKAKASSTV